MEERSHAVGGRRVQLGEDRLPAGIGRWNEMGCDNAIEVCLEVATFERGALLGGAGDLRLLYDVIEQVTLERGGGRRGARRCARLRAGRRLDQPPSQFSDAFEERQPLVQPIGVKVLECVELDSHARVALTRQPHGQLRSQPRDRFVQSVAVDDDGLVSCQRSAGSVSAVTAAAEVSEEGDTKRGFYVEPRVHRLRLDAQIYLDAVAAGSFAHRGGLVCGRRMPNLSPRSWRRKAASRL
jgi:hypothetical protein